jgi:hypothetical protein
MTNRLTSKVAIVCLALLTVIFFVTELQARRFGGGGGGISRGGIAAGGGFSGGGLRGGGRGISRDMGRGIHTDPGRGVSRDIDRRAPRDPGQRSDNLGDRQDDRQDYLDESREDRQDFAKDRQKDRQDFVEDEIDDWDRCCYDNDGGEFLAGAIVGGAIGAAAASDNTTYIVTLPCTTTAVLYDGYSFYNCSGTWYQKSYAGGDVVYVVTSPPPGY